MISVMSPDSVWSNNKKIVLMKFLKGFGYTAAIFIITFLVDLISSGNIPQEWVIYSGIMIALLQSGKKALEQYKPEKDL